MFRSIKFPYFVTLAILAVSLGACSSSKHKAEDAALTADPMADVNSPADKVGSNPEDMLANEMSAGDGKTSTPVTEDKAADPTADSFAELTKDAATTDAATVPATQPELSSSSGGGANDTYTVKSGDTLMKVAFTLYGDIDRWKDIKEWNKDKLKSNHLKRGMKLQVEAGNFQVEQRDHSYMIKKGDTLANIAQDVYGKKKKYKKLQQYNAKLVKNPNVIFAGFTLFYDITPQEVADAEAFHKNQPATLDASAAAAPASTDTAAAPAPAPWPPPSAVNPPPAMGNSAPIANNMAAPAAPAAPAKK